MDVFGPNLPDFFCFICSKQRFQDELVAENVVMELFKDSECHRTYRIRPYNKVCSTCTGKRERKLQKNTQSQQEQEGTVADSLFSELNRTDSSVGSSISVGSFVVPVESQIVAPVTGPKSAKLRWLQANRGESNAEEPAAKKQRPGPKSSKMSSSSDDSSNNNAADDTFDRLVNRPPPFTSTQNSQRVQDADMDYDAPRTVGDDPPVHSQNSDPLRDRSEHSSDASSHLLRNPDEAADNPSFSEDIVANMSMQTEGNPSDMEQEDEASGDSTNQDRRETESLSQVSRNPDEVLGQSFSQEIGANVLLEPQEGRAASDSSEGSTAGRRDASNTAEQSLLSSEDVARVPEPASQPFSDAGSDQLDNPVNQPIYNTRSRTNSTSSNDSQLSMISIAAPVQVPRIRQRSLQANLSIRNSGG